MYNSALEVNSLLQIKDVAKYLARRHVQESENKNKLTNKELELLQKLQRECYVVSVRKYGTVQKDGIGLYETVNY